MGGHRRRTVLLSDRLGPPDHDRLRPRRRDDVRDAGRRGRRDGGPGTERRGRRGGRIEGDRPDDQGVLYDPRPLVRTAVRDTVSRCTTTGRGGPERHKATALDSAPPRGRQPILDSRVRDAARRVPRDESRSEEGVTILLTPTTDDHISHQLPTTTPHTVHRKFLTELFLARGAPGAPTRAPKKIGGQNFLIPLCRV